ncbi:FkbM family methyltransferase [Candidatus Dependentiae bacterium]|nr:FkbM family methyltransferase [Candidatus Dependentiae bacterium]MBU4387295.1 FkbM family methyltransferase [Candidatus Dependentiae bacterium]MCG2756592.1 FkbM family methyltransferase [Candidatus Dependentiae bacterium]
MLNKIKKFIIKKIITQNNIFIKHQIGPYSIKLPSKHALKNYQETFKRYDIALGEIAKIINNKYPNLTAIDIGANIGDSAALLSKYNNIPTLCIEGNDIFLPILKENTKIIGTHIKIEECFVGPENIFIDKEKIKTDKGTATIVNSIHKTNSSILGKNIIQNKSLLTILNSHKKFLNFKLLKIDTDGYDFCIINDSLNIIKKLKPIIFFEYDPSIPQNGDQESIDTINNLISTGYKQFIIYDNFGNFLMSTNNPETFIDLNTYLKSNKKYKQIVYYFDICAFHEEDIDLFKKIKNIESNIAIL